MVMDGFDVQALGYVASAIIQEWGIAPSHLGESPGASAPPVAVVVALAEPCAVVVLVRVARAVAAVVPLVAVAVVSTAHGIVPVAFAGVAQALLVSIGIAARERGLLVTAPRLPPHAAAAAGLAIRRATNALVAVSIAPGESGPEPIAIRVAAPEPPVVAAIAVPEGPVVSEAEVSAAARILLALPRALAIPELVRIRILADAAAVVLPRQGLGVQRVDGDG